ncbi:acyl-CoA dehydrogenase family protein [Haliangium sp.]|uniref:acyl-CoA dehydrogenase family protein n=1 Tax=Haliangium sp. TaxID=2663208 RepID=UPI003D138501
MPQVLNLEGLALNPNQAKLRRAAQRVAKEVLAPSAEEVDRSGRFPTENFEALAKAGILGMIVPEEYGGAGAGVMTTAVVMEELARACPSTAVMLNMHISGLMVAIAMADEEQKAKFIQPVATEGQLWGFAMSERGSGSRIWHMDSHAEERDGELVFDAFKSFVSGSGEVAQYLVPVRASPDSGPSDLSLVLVEGQNPGVKPQGTWDSMGLRGTSSRPIHFQDCRVPIERRIGKATEAFSYMMAYSLPIYMVGLSAVYVGVAQTAMDVAVEHVKRRVHSDTQQSLARVETVQRYFAEMKYRMDTMRATLHRVARLADAATLLFDEFDQAEILDEIIRENPDDPFFSELLCLKLAACSMAVEVVDCALQVCGGAAYKRGHAIERCYREARAGALMAPADDAVKIIVGRQLLGMPQPWE